MIRDESAAYGRLQKAGLILIGQNGIKDDIADLQQRTARIESQLALLIDTWSVEMPPALGSADG